MPNALVATKQFQSFFDRFSQFFETENSSSSNFCKEKLVTDIKSFIKSKDFQEKFPAFVYSIMQERPELEQKNNEAFAFLSNLCKNTVGKSVKDICQLVEQQLESQRKNSPKPYGM